MERQFFANNENAIRSAFGYPFVDFTALAKENTGGSFLEYLEWLAALFLLVMISPLLLLCAASVKLTSRGPAFYTQQRVGKDGVSFTIFKFRSMVLDAERLTGPVLATKNDARVTIVGHILRATHLDELPQLFNIIRGDMTFIGPRPERPEFVNVFNESVAKYRARAAVKPGITGLAQVCCDYDATAEEKLKFDLLFIKYRQSLRMNATILYYTVRKVLFSWSGSKMAA